jgi:hypothetical protein
MRVFHGAKLNVERARSHIDALATEVSNFSRSSPYLVVVEDSGPKLKRTSPIPGNIFTILGDAVHNLRSALDHLAYELVDLETTRTGNKLPETLLWNIGFPIVKDNKHVNKKTDSFTEKIKSNQMHKAGKEVEKALQLLRPYCKGNDGLYALHDFDRTDKHRLLIPIIEVTASYSSTMTNTAPDGGTLTLSFDADEPIDHDQPIEVDDKEIWSGIAGRSFLISIDVGLPEDPFKGMRVVDWLRLMANYLDGVIAAFELLLEGKTFEPPDPIRKKLKSTGLIPQRRPLL